MQSTPCCRQYCCAAQYCASVSTSHTSSVATGAMPVSLTPPEPSPHTMPAVLVPCGSPEVTSAPPFTKSQPCTSSTKPLPSSSMPLPGTSPGLFQMRCTRSGCVIHVPLSSVPMSTPPPSMPRSHSCGAC